MKIACFCLKNGTIRYHFSGVMVPYGTTFLTIFFVVVLFVSCSCTKFVIIGAFVVISISHIISLVAL